jgi:hypothetical protein
MKLFHTRDKTYLGFAPQYQDYFFTQKSTKKPAPVKSPGVPLQRSSVRFFNSALRASDTKNLLTLAPRRSTEIFLMGQYRKPQKDSGQAGMTKKSELDVFSAFYVEVSEVGSGA